MEDPAVGVVAAAVAAPSVVAVDEIGVVVLAPAVSVSAPGAAPRYRIPEVSNARN